MAQRRHTEEARGCCGRGSVTSFPHGVSAASVSGPGLGGVCREPRQRRQEVGLLAREEAAGLDSEVSGLLGTSGQPLAWGEASAWTALTTASLHCSWGSWAVTGGSYTINPVPDTVSYVSRAASWKTNTNLSISPATTNLISEAFHGISWCHSWD